MTVIDYDAEWDMQLIRLDPGETPNLPQAYTRPMYSNEKHLTTIRQFAAQFNYDKYRMRELVAKATKPRREKQSMLYFVLGEVVKLKNEYGDISP